MQGNSSSLRRAAAFVRPPPTCGRPQKCFINMGYSLRRGYWYSYSKAHYNYYTPEHHTTSLHYVQCLSNHISRTIEVFQRPPPTQQTHSLECLVAVCVCVVDPSNIGLQLAQSSRRRSSCVRCRHSCHDHGGHGGRMAAYGLIPTTLWCW